MSNRRTHLRFELSVPCKATLRIVRDVSVTKNGDTEFVCVGTVRGIVGEEVTLEVLGASARAAVRARITDSRPVPVNGSMRYELRLRAIQETVESELCPAVTVARTK
jgi:hypothetical protein